MLRKKHSPEIRFICRPDLKGVIPEPTPAAKAIPDWYRKMPRSVSDNPRTSHSLKACVPLRDSMSLGYVIPLWEDILFDAEWNSPEDWHLRYHWPGNLSGQEPGAISSHFPEQVTQTPWAGQPTENSVLKFSSPWSIHTDPGYSCLFLAPLNHGEQRFELFSGVVDTDCYRSAIHFPFVWKNWQGKTLLEQGLPLVQVIPFKREDWQSQSREWSKNELTDIQRSDNTVQSVFRRAYERFFWQRKRFR